MVKLATGQTASKSALECLLKPSLCHPVSCLFYMKKSWNPLSQRYMYVEANGSNGIWIILIHNTAELSQQCFMKQITRRISKNSYCTSSGMLSTFREAEKGFRTSTASSSLSSEIKVPRSLSSSPSDSSTTLQSCETWECFQNLLFDSSFATWIRMPEDCFEIGWFVFPFPEVSCSVYLTDLKCLQGYELFSSKRHHKSKPLGYVSLGLPGSSWFIYQLKATIDNTSFGQPAYSSVDKKNLVIRINVFTEFFNQTGVEGSRFDLIYNFDKRIKYLLLRHINQNTRGNR